jgi:hypothetical protein
MLGSYSSVAEDKSLLECEDVSVGEQYSTFQEVVVTSSSRSMSPRR